MGGHQGDVDPGERGGTAHHQDQARHWQGLQVNQPIRERDTGEGAGLLITRIRHAIGRACS